MRGDGSLTRRNGHRLAMHHCARTGVLLCHTDAAIVAKSTAPMIVTDKPALICTHSLASIFAAVNTRSTARPLRRYRSRYTASDSTKYSERSPSIAITFEL